MTGLVPTTINYFEVQPEAIVEIVPNLEEDKRARLRAAAFIGSCLIDDQVELEAPRINPIESLYDAIHQAKEGSEDAYKMVETNVRTDVVERTIKTGHVTKVDLMVDEAGKIQQFGQSMESIQANSLRFASAIPAMRKRTEAETINSFRIEEHNRQGILDDQCFVVFSRAADDMSVEDMKEVGFFTQTMSCAIQVTTNNGGRLTTESAFVAGVKKPGEERHDKETIEKVGKSLGVDIDDLNATELLATPILIPKSLMPNGVIDLVKMYDGAAGGTFFGEERPAEEYAQYRKDCESREEALQDTVSKVTNKLISEASRITSPIRATQRLHKLSEEHMVSRAMWDSKVDARVFGNDSQRYIEQARYILATGNYYENQIESLTQLAVKSAKSSSCPSSMSSGESRKVAGSDSSEADEDCEFVSKKCPMCGAKNVKTVSTATEIKGSCGCKKKK